MKKVLKFLFLFIFSLFLSFSIVDAKQCSSIKNKDDCNKSNQNGVSCEWIVDQSVQNVDALKSVTKSGKIGTCQMVSGASSATSCTGFHTESSCKAGIGKDNARFGCAWNEKYEFCSANGLVYLSCGNTDNKTDAHDIPVIVPRLTSYGITILKTVTPVILIIISMFQLIKAIASQNEDEMKKAKSSLIKKLVISVLIFFVATIVQFIIKQVADDDELGSTSDCLSCFVNNDCSGAMYYVDGYGYCYYLSNRTNPVAATTGNCRTDIGILHGLVSDDNASSDSNNNSSSNSSDSSSDSKKSSSASNNSNSNSSDSSSDGKKSSSLSEENNEICVDKNANSIFQGKDIECHSDSEWKAQGCSITSNKVKCGVFTYSVDSN